MTVLLPSLCCISSNVSVSHLKVSVFWLQQFCLFDVLCTLMYVQKKAKDSNHLLRPLWATFFCGGAMRPLVTLLFIRFNYIWERSYVQVVSVLIGYANVLYYEKFWVVFKISKCWTFLFAQFLLLHRKKELNFCVIKIFFKLGRIGIVGNFQVVRKWTTSVLDSFTRLGCDREEILDITDHLVYW